MSHSGYGRNFEWTLRELAERGHEVHLVFDKDKGLGGLIAGLEREYPGLSVGPGPEIPLDDWSTVAKAWRIWLDYLRYLDSVFDEAPKLRARGGRRVPAGLRSPTAWLARQFPRAFRVFRTACERAHAGFPLSIAVREFVERHSPDLMVITPLLEMASPQPEYLRVGRGVGLPTCVPVASWDNLTTKGLIHDAPDLLTVWNDAQATEAESLHDVAPDRIEVTGAVAYDHWFGWEPTDDRASFCESLGLDPLAPFVLYVGSSSFIAPDEADVALRWVTGLRAANGGRLADLQVLVRPHPQNPMRGQAREHLERLDRVAIHPPKGANPMDAETRSEYFDSIHHCAAVLGVNTSALLEASIVDRPVHTVLEPGYADTQNGTLHFRHLLPENGGMLQVAATVDELAAAISSSLAAGRTASGHNAGFVTRFIRPGGLDRACSPLLAERIEGLFGRAEGTPARVPLGCRVLGLPIATIGRLYLKLVPVAIAVRHGLVHGARGLSRRVVGRVRWLRRRVARVTRRSVRRLAGPLGLEGVIWRRKQMRDLRLRMEALTDSGRPVIAGPFLGEIGFELLYWIPFLRWIAREYPKIGEQLVVVSRGGPRNWYAPLAGRYVDAFELLEPQELTGRRVGLKQRQSASELDLAAELAALASARLGIERAAELPPDALWALYYRNVKREQNAYARAVEAGGATRPGLHSVYRTFEPPPLGPLKGVLPRGDFVAVRFYFRPSFPDTEANRRLAASLIEALSQRTQVVLLNNGMELDEHRDLEVDRDSSITVIHPHMTAADNLEVQSIAISRAKGFLGTYGGLAYLPPHYGVPSVSLLEVAEAVKPWHLALAEAIFSGSPWGSIDVLSTSEERLSERVLELLGPGASGDASTYTARATENAGG